MIAGTAEPAAQARDGNARVNLKWQRMLPVGHKGEQMLNPEHLILILRRMEQVLRNNDHPGQADYVGAVATVAEWDPVAVAPALASGAIWGGSGAVVDVGRFNSADDRRLFCQLVVELAAEMRKQGIESPGADSRAAIMSQWIEKELL